MKIDVIKVDDLEDYFRFEKLRTELVIKLTRVKELTEQKLKIMESLKPLCNSIKILKDKHKIKLEDDLVKAVKKHGGY